MGGLNYHGVGLRPRGELRKASRWECGAVGAASPAGVHGEGIDFSLGKPDVYPGRAKALSDMG